MFTDITLRLIPLGLLARFWAAAVLLTTFLASAPPAQAAFEVPEGERITNIIVIGRGIPLKEQYELFDPKIGRNFDIKNLWIRADLRVRPEYRNNLCFGGEIGNGGNCNSPLGIANRFAGTANDSFVQQMTRLGIGYDLSPDVNFYLEFIDSRTWGGNGDPINHTCAPALVNNRTACSLGIRAGYMLVRNFAGIQGLGIKAGRQYLVFGDQSLLGHFDWANTGFSFDGIMTNYSTKFMDTSLGWFRLTETDLAQGAALGSGGPNINPLGQPVSGQANNAHGDVDMLVLYNQIKAVPWSLIEPFYIYYKNNLGADNNSSQGLGTPKHGNQTRHVIGNRIAVKKGGFDLSNEIVYQFGQMGSTSATFSPCGLPGTQDKCLHINAWATRNWIGYTFYDLAWKPRFALNFDYASGDGRANCTLNAAYGTCSTANTFENLYPTNHIHMGYMDVMAWKNTLTWSANFQARPTRDDHIEVWYTNLNLANARDNWYRASQGVYVFSKVGNTTNHLGDELDFTWTHMFMEGKLAFQTSFSYLFTGPYIRENLGTNKDQTWAYAQFWLNF
ncbi:MAG: alginate export family protein [Nitrospira sp.]|nr:alginate export family protein [Nitrospira sp.]